MLKTDKATFSSRMKESLLYILKHVLAEVGSYGTVISADSAKLLLNYIRSSIQDRKYLNSYSCAENLNPDDHFHKYISSTW